VSGPPLGDCETYLNTLLMVSHHLRERDRSCHAVRNGPVLRLVGTQCLLGAKSELTVRADGELLLEILYRIPARSLLKQDQLVWPIAINASGPAMSSAANSLPASPYGLSP